MADRRATLERATSETSITVEVNLDGTGVYSIETGVGFFDHILSHIAKHGLLDLSITASGDLHVDAHHLVEDVGIVLGCAIRDALGDKRGLVRYGHAVIPMDEALVLVALDVSGRPFCAVDVDMERDKVGDFDTELLVEFLRAFATNAGWSLHVRKLAGSNCHHIMEAAFKALGRAIDMATGVDERRADVPSTKGVL